MKRSAIALIDESRCIGCTRCIDACPVDAIVGAQGLMHTVIEPWCIGCGLCLPPCPVDCIEMIPARGRWTEALKRDAGIRARRRKARLQEPVFHKPEKRKAILAEILSRRRR
jgi:electron transport complex protein RnfB